MKIRSNHKMGRIILDVEIINHRDYIDAERGQLDAAKIRRKTLKGVIDSGATRLVLPSALVKELGLPVRKSKAKVRYADGRRGVRSEVEDVRLRLQGRDGTYTAVVEPKRDTVLIGAIVLEDLDFLTDCTNQRIVPRDPDHVVTEIE